MKVNIGTTKGNIVGVEVKKRWHEITSKDIYAIVKVQKPGASIIGWTPTHKGIKTKVQKGII